MQNLWLSGQKLDAHFPAVLRRQVRGFQDLIFQARKIPRSSNKFTCSPLRVGEFILCDLSPFHITRYSVWFAAPTDTLNQGAEMSNAIHHLLNQEGKGRSPSRSPAMVIELKLGHGHRSQQ